MARPEGLFGLRPHPCGVAGQAGAVSANCVGLGSNRGASLHPPNKPITNRPSGRFVIGAPGRIRTSDRLVRSQFRAFYLLY